MALQTQVSLNGALGSLLAFDLVVSLYINLRLDAMAFRVNVSLSAWKPRAQDSAADLGASSPTAAAWLRPLLAHPHAPIELPAANFFTHRPAGAHSSTGADASAPH